MCIVIMLGKLVYTVFYARFQVAYELPFVVHEQRLKTHSQHEPGNDTSGMFGRIVSVIIKIGNRMRTKTLSCNANGLNVQHSQASIQE